MDVGDHETPQVGDERHEEGGDCEATERFRVNADAAGRFVRHLHVAGRWRAAEYRPVRIGAARGGALPVPAGKIIGRDRFARRSKPNGCWAATVRLRSVRVVAKLGKLYWCTRCQQRHYRRSGIGRDHWQYRWTWYGPLVSMARSYKVKRTARRTKVRPTKAHTPPPPPRIPAARRESEATTPVPPRQKPAEELPPWKSTLERMRESIIDARTVARRRLRAKLPGATEGVIKYIFDEHGFYEGVADESSKGCRSGDEPPEVTTSASCSTQRPRLSTLGHTRRLLARPSRRA